MLTYVLGGLAVASLGTAGALWLSAEGKRGDLDGSACAPRCDQDDVDAIRERRLVGDIFLGAGVVLLGIAAVTWIVSGGDAAATARSVPGRVVF